MSKAISVLVGFSGGAIAALAVACGGSVTAAALPNEDAGTISALGDAAHGAPPEGLDAAKPPAQRDATTPDVGPTTVFPAPHPPPPQIVSSGGPVMTSPVFVTITFPGDPMAAGLEGFAEKIGPSTYWKAATGEYGVGPGTAGPPVHLTETPPEHLLSEDIGAWITDKLDGTHPEFPPADDNTLYIIYYPTSTTITLDGFGDSCATFGGYHDSVQLTATKRIIYAVMPRCQAQDGLSPLDELTFVASHEMVEAATDPLPEYDPAYARPDVKHIAWSIMPLSEVGDMCAYQGGAPLVPADIGNAVQRIWSNAAAKDLKNPCVPEPLDPYFNAVPILPDTSNYDDGLTSTVTPGVNIPVGTSRAIDVILFSNGPLDEPISVAAYDYADLSGSPDPALTFSWSSQQGQNGDTLKLTVTSRHAGVAGGAPFMVMSSSSGVINVWTGFVGQ